LGKVISAKTSLDEVRVSIDLFGNSSLPANEFAAQAESNAIESRHCPRIAETTDCLLRVNKGQSIELCGMPVAVAETAEVLVAGGAPFISGEPRTAVGRCTVGELAAW